MAFEVIHDIPLSLTPEGLFRRMGYGGRKRPPAPEIAERFAQAVGMVESEKLLKGRCVLWMQTLSSVTKNGIRTTCGIEIPGNRVFHLMPQATRVMLGLATIDNTIETLSRKYVKSDDPLLGVMLDSIGSTAVDCLTEEISGIVREHAMEIGLMSSSPISPGMPGLALETQKIFFDLLPADEIGMKITPNHMMVPFKSSSMLWGLGKTMPNWSKEEICKACHLFRHCRYKTIKKENR